ncbi:MAG: class I SAM-dependent methyltransferase [Roseicyclus sp.]
MTHDRWTLAQEAGVLPPVHGPLLALMPRAEAELEMLAAPDQVTAVQGFKPDHDRLAARGFATALTPEGKYGAALVQIVKSKPGTLSAIAEALVHLAPGGLLLVDGAKEEGIESVLKALKGVLPVDDVYSKAHGKLIWLTRPDHLPEALMDWIAEPAEIEGGYITAPGGFSVDGPDRGSEILVALLPQLSGRVADLGAGWGYVAAEVLAEHEGIEILDLIEADHPMLEAAKANIDDPRARFHWADAALFKPDAPYDVVLSNPPFHTGRRADPGLGRAFIQAAARLLTPRGRFFMVANRHLPYEPALKDAFTTGRLMGELEGYKLYEASKPRRQTRA